MATNLPILLPYVGHLTDPTCSSLTPSRFLIHVFPCVWGSMRSGKRAAFVTMIPFCTDSSSLGRPWRFHSPTWDRPHQCVPPRAVMVVGPTGKVLEVPFPDLGQTTSVCTTQSCDGGGTYREGPGGSIPRHGTDHQCVPPRAVMVGPTGKVLEVPFPDLEQTTSVYQPEL